ncbi:hypothetical protein chiPu_0016803 [Chiloscyllium punctatum]|uniref:Uncharacterized protein n=1 Tax=Chiloscyllium punctatum TaxID=137246 RepID=A0A401T6L5_CHIPU|nr:hypothetical protein [Chiloscyllium punctatum]
MKHVRRNVLLRNKTMVVLGQAFVQECSLVDEHKLLNVIHPHGLALLRYSCIEQQLPIEMMLLPSALERQWARTWKSEVIEVAL